MQPKLRELVESAHRDIEELATGALALVQDRLGGDHAIFFDLDETSGALRAVARVGTIEEMLEQDMRNFAQQAVNRPSEETLVLSADPLREKELAAKKSIRRDMAKGVVVFPLTDGDRGVGVIYVGQHKPESLKLDGVTRRELLELGAFIGQLVVLHRSLRRLTLQNQALRHEVGQEASLSELIGSSEAINRVRDALALVSDTDVVVTLVGERGTGKGIAAEAIHHDSARSRRPFINLPLRDLPEQLHEGFLFGQLPGDKHAPPKGRRGALRDAHEGSLAIEGIDHMSLELQRRVAESMQRGQFHAVDGNSYPLDIRLILTTETSPRELNERGGLDESFRLMTAQFPVLLPPLRKRLEDLPALVEHYMQRAMAAYGKELAGVSSEVYSLLGEQNWEENLLQLEREIRHAVLRAPDYSILSPSMLSSRLRGTSTPALMGGEEGTLKQRLARIEKRMIIDALEAHNHNQSATADRLGLSRQALINKLQRYGIETGRKFKRERKQIEKQARKG